MWSSLTPLTATSHDSDRRLGALMSLALLLVLLVQGSHSSLEVEARRSLDNLNRSSSRGSRDQMHHAPQPPHQLPHLERSGSSSPLPPLSPGPPSEEFKLVTESSKLMWRSVIHD